MHCYELVRSPEYGEAQVLCPKVSVKDVVSILLLDSCASHYIVIIEDQYWLDKEHIDQIHVEAFDFCVSLNSSLQFTLQGSLDERHCIKLQVKGQVIHAHFTLDHISSEINLSVTEISAGVLTWYVDLGVIQVTVVKIKAKGDSFASVSDSVVDRVVNVVIIIHGSMEGEFSRDRVIPVIMGSFHEEPTLLKVQSPFGTGPEDFVN